jgi:hypothetical protein
MLVEIEMPLSGRGRTFAFESCKDMLTKLAWEAENLDRHIKAGRGVAEATYWATNAAITAWHIVDWVWADLNSEQRSALGGKLGITLGGNDGKKQLEEFVCRNQNLNICRAIALTAKHSILAAKSAARFEAIEAEVTLVPTIVTSGISHQNPFELIVKVEGQLDTIVNVLWRASSYWEEFVRSNGIAADF